MSNEPSTADSLGAFGVFLSLIGGLALTAKLAYWTWTTYSPTALFMGIFAIGLLCMALAVFVEKAW